MRERGGPGGCCFLRLSYPGKGCAICSRSLLRPGAGRLRPGVMSQQSPCNLHCASGRYRQRGGRLVCGRAMHHRCCRFPDSGGSEANWQKLCFAAGAAGPGAAKRAGWRTPRSVTRPSAGRSALAPSCPAGCSDPPRLPGHVRATGSAARRPALILYRRPGSRSPAQIPRLSPDGG